jgi:MYXO-CTERM domain-containing protein
VFPAICDENGACVLADTSPPPAESGCAVSHRSERHAALTASAAWLMASAAFVRRRRRTIRGSTPSSCC